MSPEAEDRPDSLNTVSQRIETGFGRVYVNITETDDGRPFEVFVNAGNSGGPTKSLCEAIGRLASIALRSGVEPGEVIDALLHIRAGRVDYDNGDIILSIPDAVAVAMQRHIDGRHGESIRGKEIDNGEMP